MSPSTSRGRAAATLLAGFVALTTVSACASSDNNDDDGTVRFAVTDLQGLEELQREFGAFSDELSAASGLEFEFFAVTNRSAAAEALRSSQVDVVFTGPAEYIVIHEKTGAEPIVAIERDRYRSCVYTRADSTVTALTDLRGKKVAMSDIGSTSGHLGPSQMLLDAGVDPLSEVTVLTVGDTVHEALKRGDVDAVGVGCHDYEEFMADDDPAAYRLVAEGDVLPPDLLMGREGLDPQVADQIREAFNAEFDVLLAAMLEGKDNAKYANARLANVTDSDYDVVRSMYRAVGVNDFTEFVGN